MTRRVGRGAMARALVRGAGAGGAGGLPSGLEGDGHRLVPGAAKPGLVRLGGLGGGGHDADAVERAVGVDQGDPAEPHRALDATAGAEEAGGHLLAITAHVALGVRPGEGSGAAAVGHWKVSGFMSIWTDKRRQINMFPATYA